MVMVVCVCGGGEDKRGKRMSAQNVLCTSSVVPQSISDGLIGAGHAFPHRPAEDHRLTAVSVFRDEFPGLTFPASLCLGKWTPLVRSEPRTSWTVCACVFVCVCAHVSFCGG